MMNDPAVVNPREPWAVSFGTGKVFAGCILTSAIFMGLIFVWLSVVVPADVLESTDPPMTVGRLTVTLGGFGGVFFLVVGPTVAFAIGWLLRRVANQSVHVLVFALAGATIGAAVGSLFGADMANALGSTMGTSVGLSRMIMSRFAHV